MILLSMINFRLEDYNDLLRNLDLISMSIVTFQRALQINGANFVANMSDYSIKRTLPLIVNRPSMYCVRSRPLSRWCHF